MSNFSTAVEATATAMNSAGSAAQENSAYMESLEAKTQQLKATFEDFSNNVIESDLVKSILDLANNALSALNTETGATITQWTLLTGVLTGGLTIFGQIAGKLVSGVAHIGTAFKTLAGVFTGATTGVAGFASAALPVAGIIAGIAVAGYNIYKAWKKANPTLEEATQKVQDLETELQTNQERLEEINEIPWYDRTEEMKAEKEELEKLNAELQENLELAKQQKVEAAQKTADAKRTETVQQYELLATPGTSAASYLPSFETKAGTFENYEDLIKYVAELTDKNELLSMSTEDAKEAIKEMGFAIAGYSAEVEISAEESNQKYIDSLNEIAEKYQTAISNDKPISTILGIRDAFEEQLQVGSKLAESYQILKDNGKELDELEQNFLDTYNSKQSLLNTLNGQLERQARLEDTVRSSVKLTDEQLKYLNDTYSDLSGSIVTVEGQSYLLKDALLELAAAGDAVAISMAEAALNTALMAQSSWREKMASTPMGMLDETLRSAYGDEAVNSLFVVPDDLQQKIDEAEQFYEDLKKAIEEGKNAGDKITLDDIVEDDGGGGGGGSSASKAAEDILQPLKDYLEKEDHKVFLLDKQDQEGNAQEIINIYKNAQKAIANYANALRAKGYAEDSEQIRELQELWWEYQDEIDSVYDAIEQRAEEARQKIEEETQKQIDALTSETNVYEQLFSYMTDQIDKEIEALEKQRDAEEQLWDDKIDALQEQNDEIERQIQLEELQDQLARARQSQVLVYKDGRFQYVGDIDEVSEAQKNLEDYEREEALRKETENLEKLKEEALAAIDKQIEGWEKYKEEWSSVVEDYQEEQDRLMIEQELGIKLEGEHWRERLDNLAEYVAEYKRLMEELSALQLQQNQEASGGRYLESVNGKAPEGAQIGDYIVTGGGTYLITGGTPGNWESVKVSDTSKHSYGSSSSSGSSGGKTLQSVNGKAPEGAQIGDKIVTGGGTYQIVGGTPGNWESVKVSDVSKHAKGTLSASGGLSLVGENGPELRWINSGDGILPANITKNLWGWGSMSPSEFMSKSSGTSVVIQNLNLPNVRDPQDFTNYLKNNFWRKTVQFQTSK